MSDLMGPFTRVDHGDYWDTMHAVYAAAPIQNPLQSLAQLLAEPLRRAYREHVDEWGPCCQGGTAYCPEAQRLDQLRPWGDRVMFPPMGGAS